MLAILAKWFWCSWVLIGPAIGSLFPRIIAGMQIFESERTGRAYLRDVLTGFRPMEVRRVSRENDDAPRGIGFHLIAIELIAEANVEDARHDRVDPVLRMLVRH